MALSIYYGNSIIDSRECLIENLLALNSLENILKPHTVFVSHQEISNSLNQHLLQKSKTQMTGNIHFLIFNKGFYHFYQNPFKNSSVLFSFFNYLESLNQRDLKILFPHLGFNKKMDYFNSARTLINLLEEYSIYDPSIFERWKKENKAYYQDSLFEKDERIEEIQKEIYLGFINKNKGILEEEYKKSFSELAKSKQIHLYLPQNLTPKEIKIISFWAQQKLNVNLYLVNQPFKEGELKDYYAPKIDYLEYITKSFSAFNIPIKEVKSEKSTFNIPLFIELKEEKGIQNFEEEIGSIYQTLFNQEINRQTPLLRDTGIFVSTNNTEGFFLLAQYYQQAIPFTVPLSLTQTAEENLINALLEIIESDYSSSSFFKFLQNPLLLKGLDVPHGELRDLEKVVRDNGIVKAFHKDKNLDLIFFLKHCMIERFIEGSITFFSMPSKDFLLMILLLLEKIRVLEKASGSFILQEWIYLLEYLWEMNGELKINRVFNSLYQDAQILLKQNHFDINFEVFCLYLRIFLQNLSKMKLQISSYKGILGGEKNLFGNTFERLFITSAQDSSLLSFNLTENTRLNILAHQTDLKKMYENQLIPSFLEMLFSSSECYFTTNNNEIENIDSQVLLIKDCLKRNELFVREEFVEIGKENSLNRENLKFIPFIQKKFDKDVIIASKQVFLYLQYPYYETLKRQYGNYLQLHQEINLYFFEEGKLTNQFTIIDTMLSSIWESSILIEKDFDEFLDQERKKLKLTSTLEHSSLFNEFQWEKTKTKLKKVYNYCQEKMKDQLIPYISILADFYIPKRKKDSYYLYPEIPFLIEETRIKIHPSLHYCFLKEEENSILLENFHKDSLWKSLKNNEIKDFLEMMINSLFVGYYLIKWKGKKNLHLTFSYQDEKEKIQMLSFILHIEELERYLHHFLGVYIKEKVIGYSLKTVDAAYKSFEKKKEGHNVFDDPSFLDLLEEEKNKEPVEDDFIYSNMIFSQSKAQEKLLENVVQYSDSSDEELKKDLKSLYQDLFQFFYGQTKKTKDEE